MLRFCKLLGLFCLLSIFGCGGSTKLVTYDTISREQLMFLHNIERGSRELQQLNLDPELAKRSQMHAEWMALNNSLKHSKLGGTDYSIEGENIAKGHISEEEVVKAWMDSPGHRKNILNGKFTNAGFGYAKRSDGTTFWCAQFGGK